MPTNAFLSFVRRKRLRILAEHPEPTTFCVALATDQTNSKTSIEAANLLRELEGDQRDYAISSAYALLIGAERRKHLSAYFTPPVLADAALEAAAPFLSFDNPSVLDPACGGGSFLVPAARRIISDKLNRGVPTAQACAQTLDALAGIEVDLGLALLSASLLQGMLKREHGVSSRRKIVRKGDALAIEPIARYDLVVGNPPYGRVRGRIEAQLLAKAGRADLGGHTNLYALFLLRALDWLKPSGGLVFVLPTSFVAGPYFAGLRQEVLERAQVLRIDLHEQRENLFVGAVQDVCLLTLRRRRKDGRLELVSGEDYELGVIDAFGRRQLLGRADVAPNGAPWLLPLSARGGARLPPRLEHDGDQSVVLADYGYRIRVGKVVPTRERDQLRCKPTKKSLPLLWASDVRPDGTFVFSNGQRSKISSWYEPPTQGECTTRTPAVLVQRTSNRDQRRRLNAAAVPIAFFKQHAPCGFVAENHVIVIEAMTESPAVSPEMLVAILNSAPVNERFSTVSGSFSVPATLLARLALPHPRTLPLQVDPRFEAMLRLAFEAIGGLFGRSQCSGDQQEAREDQKASGPPRRRALG